MMLWKTIALSLGKRPPGSLTWGQAQGCDGSDLKVEQTWAGGRVHAEVGFSQVALSNPECGSGCDACLKLTPIALAAVTPSCLS